MHDLHEADKIHKLIIQYAQQNKLSKVTKVVLGLGQVIEHGMEINPENLEFNIRMLAKGGVADGAEVVIEKVSGDSWELVEIGGE